MKIAVFGLTAFLFASCGSVLESSKDIKYMPIRFKPLSRNDITLVGNLQAESTVMSKATKYGMVLTGTYAKNKKKGLVSNQGSTTEILYFAPGAGEAITGSLYNGSEIQEVAASKSSIRASIDNRAAANARNEIRERGWLAYYLWKLRQAKVTANQEDQGVNFAYYALVEKYPDIDYFINVRFDRKTTAKGGLITETIIIKADGVKLKTD